MRQAILPRAVSKRLCKETHWTSQMSQINLKRIPYLQWNAKFRTSRGNTKKERRHPQSSKQPSAQHRNQDVRASPDRDVIRALAFPPPRRAGPPAQRRRGRGSGRKYLRAAGGGPGRSPSVPVPTAPTPGRTHHPSSGVSAGRNPRQRTAALAHHGAAPSSPALSPQLQAVAPTTAFHSLG